MSDDELTDKLNQLTPENLLSIFRAILLCEVCVYHVQDGFTKLRGQGVQSLQDNLSVGNSLESDLRSGIAGNSADVGLRSAA